MRRTFVEKREVIWLLEWKIRSKRTYFKGERECLLAVGSNLEEREGLTKQVYSWSHVPDMWEEKEYGRQMQGLAFPWRVLEVKVYFSSPRGINKYRICHNIEKVLFHSPKDYYYVSNLFLPVRLCCNFSTLLTVLWF